MSCGHDAGQVLLETQVRLAGEPVWIRTDCSKKTVYFPLDFAVTLGIGNERMCRAMLLNLHLLLPTIGPACPAPFMFRLRRALHRPGCSLRKFSSERGKLRVFPTPGHVNGTFVLQGIPGGKRGERARGSQSGIIRSTSIPRFNDWPEEQCHSSADIRPSAHSDRNSAPRLESPWPTGLLCHGRRGC